MRVVSLVPSVTESLLAWGIRPVACTRFCEQPELTHVGGTKDPDLDAIIGLHPDLVVLCEEENLLAHHEALVAAGLATFVFRIDGIDDVAPSSGGSRRVGAEVEIGEPTDPWPAAAPPRLTAFVPVWRRPWMSLAAGTYGSSLLAAAGVANVFADAETRYPEVELAEVSARRPDVILAPTEPYPFAERHLPELEEIAPAVLVDGQDLFWWGTRTPSALDRLRRQLATVEPRRPA